MDNLIQLIKDSTEVLYALGAFIIAAIAIYREIRAKLREKAKDALDTKIIEIAAEAMAHPQQLYHTLVNKPEIDNHRTIDDNATTMIMAIATFERNPEIVAKAGIKDIDALYDTVMQVRNKIAPLTTHK